MPGPMHGVRVIDFSSSLAGPLAAGMLSEQGAEVIKVERLEGDFARETGTVYEGLSALFHMANRGKRSIALDLAQPEARALALELTATADVVIHNFRPGAAERLGLGYDAVRARNAAVIYVAVSGFGSDGPHARRKAMDGVIQAGSGMADAQRDPRSAEPQLIQQMAADKLTALYAAQAIGAALFARERGAGGQRIDLSMLDAAISFLWPDSAGRAFFPDAAKSLPSSAVGHRQCLRFADGWMFVVILSEADFDRACHIFRIDRSAYEAAATVAGREQHRAIFADFMQQIRVRALDMTVAHAEEQLLNADIGFSVVRSVDQLASDAQVKANGLISETLYPRVGRVRQPRAAALFSATANDIPHTSPELGADGRAIVESLGRSDYDRLRAKGIIG
jgi:crotonobetainyl-CoA:carnitine CoA-transferase CaiB-like acyl-CoA transferase